MNSRKALNRLFCQLFIKLETFYVHAYLLCWILRTTMNKGMSSQWHTLLPCLCAGFVLCSSFLSYAVVMRRKGGQGNEQSKSNSMHGSQMQLSCDESFNSSCTIYLLSLSIWSFTRQTLNFPCFVYCILQELRYTISIVQAQKYTLLSLISISKAKIYDTNCSRTKIYTFKVYT